MSTDAGNEVSFGKILELDFSEIDEKLKESEISSEVKHQIDNVLSTVKEAIEKLKISLILPQIFENPRVLKQYLENTKYANCLELVHNYKNKMKSRAPQEVDHNDYDTIQIVDYFQENYKILEYLPNWLDDIDNTEKYLLTAFGDVYNIARDRFHRPATVDLAKEKRLHEVYLANEEVKEKMKEVMHKITTSKTRYNWKLVATKEMIKNLEEELAFLQYDNNMLVRRRRLASHQEIQQMNNAFIPKQQDLEESLTKARSNYESEVRDNTIKEQRIREERNKLQLQLQALLKKYDDTMLEKSSEEVLLQEEHDKQQQRVNNLLKVYEEEEAKYDKVASEMQRLHEAKVEVFTHNRAAKKIQRWWRELRKTKDAARSTRAEKRKKKQAKDETGAMGAEERKTKQAKDTAGSARAEERKTKRAKEKAGSARAVEKKKSAPKGKKA